jgi:cephalosporin hydroxylase
VGNVRRMVDRVFTSGRVVGVGKRLYPAYARTIAPLVRNVFFHDLLVATGNFRRTTWLGQPILQNVLDLWVIQEAIAELRPALIVESGTNRGGSSLFYAHLFDLLGRGSVVTVDIEKLHDLSHPRVTFLIGSSTDEEIVEVVRGHAERADGPVMVILDSDHAKDHVRRELELYAPLVTPGSYCLVQDGVMDELRMFAKHRPGPLSAIHDFVREHWEFEVDDEKSTRFLISHHPRGWLKRSAREA